jgi:hypothetical protein
VEAGVKKWVAITCVAAGAWLIAFAVFDRRQTPSEDSPYAHPALSKETRAILDSSESFVLVSIDPTPPFPENHIDSLTDLFANEKSQSPATTTEPKRDTRELFHEYPVLGRMEIKDPKRKSQLLSALYRGVKKSGGVPACFEPRHGIIAKKGTNTVELAICFACEQIAEYSHGNHAWSLMGKEPRKLFNRTLTDARVPLANGSVDN